MSNYDVKYTDSRKPPIPVNSESENDYSLDVKLFGRSFLEYGEQLNEALLSLLENFACPEDSLNPGNPDTQQAVDSRLDNPTEGQLWYNSDAEIFYVWERTAWRPLSTKSDVAANWGTILDGETIPLPVNLVGGYEFPISECIWMVSPNNATGRFDYFVCSVDINAMVTMKYRYVGDLTATSGLANYIIIGIKGNVNGGSVDCVYAPIPSPTPTPTASNTPTPSVTASNTPTPTPTPSVGSSLSPTPTLTPTPSVTATNTPTPTPTLSPGASPSPTPDPTPEPTPEPSADPTPEPSPDPTPEPTPDATSTPTPTPSVTPDPTPEPTPDATPSPTPTVTPSASGYSELILGAAGSGTFNTLCGTGGSGSSIYSAGTIEVAASGASGSFACTPSMNSEYDGFHNLNASGGSGSYSWSVDLDSCLDGAPPTITMSLSTTTGSTVQLLMNSNGPDGSEGDCTYIVTLTDTVTLIQKTITVHIFTVHGEPL